MRRALFVTPLTSYSQILMNTAHDSLISTFINSLKILVKLINP